MRSFVHKLTVYIDIKCYAENDKIKKKLKRKHIVTIMSQPHAYLHPTYKTPAKFQKYKDLLYTYN